MDEMEENAMKKILPLILVFMMVLSLAACRGQTSDNSVPTDNVSTEESSGEEKETTQKEPETEKDEAESLREADVKEEASSETEEPSETVDETIAEDAPGLVDGMRPEFKAAMDSYEAFYDEYCEFMKEYKANPTDIKLLAEYSDMAKKLVDMDEAFKEWESNDLNDEELKYYIDVSSRIAQKLLDVAE